ncbi:hypothetical protein BLOT_004944 [Blomia tropicalis]|nr:hypothetical protein BLOT_004944 [Blomia tropicalis]
MLPIWCKRVYTFIVWQQIFISIYYGTSSTNSFQYYDSLAMFPRPTETRQVQSLDGVWNFCLQQGSENGFKSRWFETPLNQVTNDLERMPVPSSFNDITERREIRDFSGWVWYERTFFIPSTWTDGNILLRFGSVNYKAHIYINGKNVFNHTGGHLPFQMDITKLVRISSQNHISVAVNNVLSNGTLPQGRVVTKNDSRKPNTTFTETITRFDFFNYAGIHRSVWLYYVPKTRIVDITVITNTESDLSTGIVSFDIATNSKDEDNHYWRIGLYDRDDKSVAPDQAKPNGKFVIPDANLWWPFTMHPIAGYQYTLSIRLYNKTNNHLIDSYYQKVGIRNITLSKHSFNINGKPFYFRGFGKHEDMNIRGRSMDQSMILKDFNLMKWIGANSFRTSHYPYSEEIMDEADEQGFVVIDELPAVGLVSFQRPLLEQHLMTARELIDRDKNRPSVVMWSIANEPVGNVPESAEYFATVATEVRRLDLAKRPVTAALANNKVDYIVPSLDLLMINRYYSWYSDPGYVQVIQGYLLNDVRNMAQKFHKLIMFSEYGADTIPGMHNEPTTIFSEDYQVEYLIENHKAFDKLRAQGFLIGEHVWNFADFMTGQQITRVGGNKKGIFTRDRQPKVSARLMRCRYWGLTNVNWTTVHRQGFSLCPQMIY